MKRNFLLFGLALSACFLAGCGDNSPQSVSTLGIDNELVAATTIQLEAESAVLSGGAKKNTNHTGYTGTGFVDGFYNSSTATVSFTVNVPSAGTYTLSLRYSAGIATSTNTALYVGTTKIKNITCAKTTNWDTWATVAEKVTLNAGNNTVVLKTASATTACINIDNIIVTGATLYTIAASAGSNGTISPTGSVSVSSGTSQTFAITPNSGYAVDVVTVDGTSQGAVTSYTFANVTAAHTISATFKSVTTYVITASAGANGTISPSGSVTVIGGASRTFTVAPNSGYQIAAVTVDGTSQGAVASYTFNNVTGNHAIAATFTQLPASNIIEAENATLAGGAKKNTNHTGYLGTGFVDGFYNSSTANVTFTVTTAAAGSYTLTLRYSAGNATSSNTRLAVNGTTIKNITCNKTTNWDTWANQTETVTLRAGSNTVVYSAATSSGNCINLDRLTITAVMTVAPGEGQTINQCVSEPATVTAPGATKYEWYADFWGTGSYTLLLADNSDYRGQGTPTLTFSTSAGAMVYCMVTSPTGSRVKSATWVLGSAYCMTVTPAAGQTINQCVSEPATVTAPGATKYEWYADFWGTGSYTLLLADNSDYRGQGTPTLTFSTSAGAMVYCMVTSPSGSKVKSATWVLGSAYCMTVTPAAGQTINQCVSEPATVTAPGATKYEWYADFWGTGSYTLLLADNSDYRGQGTPTLTFSTSAGAMVYCMVTSPSGSKVKSGTWVLGSAYCMTVTPAAGQTINQCVSEPATVTAPGATKYEWYADFWGTGSYTLLLADNSDYRGQGTPTLTFSTSAGAMVYCMVTSPSGSKVKSATWVLGSAYCMTVTPAAGQTINQCVSEPATVTAPGATKYEWYADFWGTGSYTLLLADNSDYRGQGTPTLTFSTSAGAMVYCMVTSPSGSKVKSATWVLGSAYCMTVTPAAGQTINQCISEPATVTAPGATKYEWYADFWGTGSYTLLLADNSDYRGQGTPTLTFSTSAGASVYCMVTSPSGSKVKSGTWVLGSAYCMTVTPAAGQTINQCVSEPATVTAPGATKYEWYADFWGTGSYTLLLADNSDYRGQGTPTLTFSTSAGAMVYCMVTSPSGSKVKSGTWVLGTVYCP